jgi:triosephosphate isomerase (TIM)
MRSLIIAGNWKMNKDLRETEHFCSGLAEYLRNHSQDLVLPLIAPVFPCLPQAQEILHGIPVHVAAQDVSSHAEGAYTGEVSAEQLRSFKLKYCIIGHSERRQYHKETNTQIREKLLRLREHDIIPILCIGETLEQREDGHTEQVLDEQLKGCLHAIPLATGHEIVIAYEPVWAIGTGRTASAEQAQTAHAFIRSWLYGVFGQGIAERVRILYGGSVKPENISELLHQPDIDGGLIGGASLKLAEFCAMLGIAGEVSKTK